ncbi:VOC family protein [Penaeicola halotolerans]|uniref:VOC family protein n=1 Tax=Penaeicola halotolerans TaxID=2793196 RepID=UPI001CF81807|nr:VOC family protein [Penaeicola halotolerans]
MKKVTGIGGVFFKCEDREKMRAWYAEHLGIHSEEWGGVFEWRDKTNPDIEGYTAWSPFKQETRYFDPSKQDFMINYRVDDLEALAAELKKAGIEEVGEREYSDFGKFTWIMDPEGRKIELWEPPKGPNKI